MLNRENIVLIDLDRTILNDNYEIIGEKLLKQIIRLATTAGLKIGINSDSPLITIEYFSEILGINGPLIFEMGGYSMDGTISDLSEAARPLFKKIREKIFEALKETTNTLVSVDRDRIKEKRRNEKYPGYNHIIFINPLRDLSFGMWIESVKVDGTTFLDEIFFNEIKNIVLEIVKKIIPLSQMDFDFSPQYGVIIIKLKEYSSKTKPATALGTRFMIGDSISDLIRNEFTTTLAVANASLKLKRSLKPNGYPYELISRSEYGYGVAEHLLNILKYLGKTK